MTTKEIRKNASAKLKERLGKAMLVSLTYTIITLLMNYIPMAGGIATIVIGPVLIFGLYKAIIMLIQGKQVKAFDFFTLGFDNFSKVWGLIWEVFKKTWVPLLLIIVGAIIMLAGVMAGAVWSIGTAGMSSSSIGDTASSVMSIVMLVAMLIGFGVMIGGSIWYFIKSLKYILVNFYLAKNPNLSAKEIMAMNEQDMQGNVGKMARIMIFYLLITMGIVVLGWIITFIVSFVVSSVVIAASASTSVIELIANFIGLLFGIAISVINAIVVTPRMVASYNELHEYITRNRTNNNFNGNNINSNYGLNYNNEMNNNYNVNYGNSMNNNYGSNYNNEMNNNYNVNYDNGMNNNYNVNYNNEMNNNYNVNYDNGMNNNYNSNYYDNGMNQ